MISTLNFNVTIHDDTNSYIYDDYDAIVISRTIGESGTVDSLKEASIPILTMELVFLDFNTFKTLIRNFNASFVFFCVKGCFYS